MKTMHKVLLATSVFLLAQLFLQLSPSQTMAACGNFRELGGETFCFLTDTQSTVENFASCSADSAYECCQSSAECNPSPKPSCAGFCMISGQICPGQDFTIVSDAACTGAAYTGMACCPAGPPPGGGAPGAGGDTEPVPFQVLDGPSNETFDSLNPLKRTDTQSDQSVGASLSTPGGIVSRLLAFALPMSGLILFVMLVWGGFEILAGSATSKSVDAGKQRITAAIVGFFLLFSSYWIVQILEVVFAVKIL